MCGVGEHALVVESATLVERRGHRAEELLPPGEPGESLVDGVHFVVDFIVEIVVHLDELLRGQHCLVEYSRLVDSQIFTDISNCLGNHLNLNLIALTCLKEFLTAASSCAMSPVFFLCSSDRPHFSAISGL